MTPHASNIRRDGGPDMTAPMDPRARVGDADREQAVADLERYVSEGYLTLDEFSDRSAAAYRATTYGELAALTQDLRAGTDRARASATGRRAVDPRSWTPAVAVAAAVAGAVLLLVIAMVLIMVVMMGGMGSMGDMGGMR